MRNRFFEPDIMGNDLHVAMMKGLCDRRNRRTRSVQFSNLKPGRSLAFVVYNDVRFSRFGSAE